MNVDKQQHDVARELHLTFASVGGGLHLAILAFKVHELLSTSVWAPGFGRVEVGLHLVAIAVCWWRLYWVYLNTLVFFVPFDNAGVFSIDLASFFLGGVALFFIGQTGPCLLAGGICLLTCWCRIMYTFRRAGERALVFPSSVRRYQQIHSRFRWLLLIPTGYALVVGCVLLTLDRPPLSGQTATALFLVSCLVVLYRFDPFFPVREDLAFSNENSAANTAPPTTSRSRKDRVKSRRHARTARD
jgi:hypothetical protein